MSVLSVNETTTFRWSFEEDAAHYAAAGIRAMGVWRQKLSDCGIPKAQQVLETHGMAVSHLFWAGGFTGSDGRTHRESIDDAAEALRSAAQLGSKILVLHSGPRGGHTQNHARQLFVAALRELAAEACELKVDLAVEPMHAGCAGEWTFLTKLDDTLELLDMVGCPQAKMVLDTYHLGLEPGLAEKLPSIVDRIAIVQLGDARRPPAGEQNRCRLGDGLTPLPEIVTALKAGGYVGYYDVELLGEELEELDYQNLLDHAKAAYQTLVG